MGKSCVPLLVSRLTSRPVDAVTITGQLGSETLRRDDPGRECQEQATYLPRIWAKLAIDDMVMRDAQANKAAIIELSKSMYVMSPFTSLLVLENDAMYDQYNVDRGRKDHWALYPCPEKIDVVHEPLEGPQQGDPPDRDTPTAKPSPAEVLRTLLVRHATWQYANRDCGHYGQSSPLRRQQDPVIRRHPPAGNSHLRPTVRTSTGCSRTSISDVKRRA